MAALTEQQEIQEHRVACHAARLANGTPRGSDRSHGCYWGDDGWWISCDAVFEIMRRHDSEHNGTHGRAWVTHSEEIAAAKQRESRERGERARTRERLEDANRALAAFENGVTS